MVVLLVREDDDTAHIKEQVQEGNENLKLMRADYALVALAYAL